MNVAQQPTRGTGQSIALPEPPKESAIWRGSPPMLVYRMGTPVDMGSLWAMRTFPSEGAPGKRFLLRPTWTPGDLHIAYAYKSQLGAKSELNYRLILLPSGESVGKETGIQDIHSSGRGLMIYIDPVATVSESLPEAFGDSGEKQTARGQNAYFIDRLDSAGTNDLIWWDRNGFVYSIVGNYSSEELVRVADSMR